MFTYDEAQALTALPKKVEVNEVLKDTLTFDQPIPFVKKFILLSETMKMLHFFMT